MFLGDPEFAVRDTFVLQESKTLLCRGCNVRNPTVNVTTLMMEPHMVNSLGVVIHHNCSWAQLSIVVGSQWYDPVEGVP